MPALNPDCIVYGCCSPASRSKGSPLTCRWRCRGRRRTCAAAPAAAGALTATLGGRPRRGCCWPRRTARTRTCIAISSIQEKNLPKLHSSNFFWWPDGTNFDSRRRIRMRKRPEQTQSKLSSISTKRTRRCWHRRPFWRRRSCPCRCCCRCRRSCPCPCCCRSCPCRCCCWAGWRRGRGRCLQLKESGGESEPVTLVQASLDAAGHVVTTEGPNLRLHVWLSMTKAAAKAHEAGFPLAAAETTSAETK